MPGRLTPPPLGAALPLGAIAAALFLNKQLIVSFSLAVMLLLVWCLAITLRSYRTQLLVPRDPLALSLFLFAVWLAVSLNWSQVPSMRFINFWWAMAFPLAFWNYIHERDRDRSWKFILTALLAVALALSLVSYHQFYILREQASSVFETRNSHAAFLNLVVLPASAWFLHGLRSGAGRRAARGLLGAALFLIFLSVALTTSRGAILSLLAAMALLAATAYGHASRRSIVSLLVILGSALLAGELSQGLSPEDPRPLLDASNRLILWKPAWRMLMEAPWLGIGLGTFFLAWPPYQDPRDTSAGFFAHNDYLQIWIETGLPGLALFLAIFVSLAWLMFRILRDGRIAGAARVELSGLFCGLAAVAMHSFVDFNFYVLAIMTTAGLVLGRFHHLAGIRLGLPALALRPSRRIGRALYTGAAILLLLLPVPYLAGTLLGAHFIEVALDSAKRGELEEANQYFRLAGRFAPGDDRILFAHADLFRQSLQLMPSAPAERKKALFGEALRLLDRAEAINPLRWDIYVVRGRLYQQNPALAGERWRSLAAEAYEQALRRNPRLYVARIDYANLLRSEGETQKALAVLDAGTHYVYYYSTKDLIFYYLMAIRAYEETGREADARRVAALLQRAAQRLKGSQAPPATPLPHSSLRPAEQA